MTQSRLGSLLESIANIAVGYGVAVASQLLIFPLFGIHIPLSDNLLIGVWFTIISLARSYAIRRWFNGFRAPLATEPRTPNPEPRPQ
jgi:hypothetical protein